MDDRDIMPIRRKFSDSVSYDRFENTLNKYVDDFIGHMDNFFNRDLQGFLSGGGIKTDIRETDREYIIEADMPGFDKKDIQVELVDDKLTISAKKDESMDVEDRNYIRKERRYGTVSRSFSVQSIVHEGVKAEYKNGVLTITLPKDEEAIKRGRNIEIQ